MFFCFCVCDRSENQPLRMIGAVFFTIMMGVQQVVAQVLEIAFEYGLSVNTIVEA